MNTQNDRVAARPLSPFAVGEVVYFPCLVFERDGWTVKVCEVREMQIVAHRENYLGRLGFRYVAVRADRPAHQKSDEFGTPYPADRLFSVRDSAVASLRGTVERRMHALKCALESIS